MSNEKMTPQERYNKEKTKMYAIRVVLDTEQDVIQKLDSVSNKSGYIKNLIRADIAQNETGDTTPNSYTENARLIIGLRLAGWSDVDINDFVIWLATGAEEYKPKQN